MPRWPTLLMPLLPALVPLVPAAEPAATAPAVAAATAGIDAATAAKWLAEVEANLRNQKWNLAVGGARRIIDHKAPAEIAKRAEAIDAGIPRVRALLAALAVPDELVRLPETAPGQVEIGPPGARKSALALDGPNGVAIESSVLPYIAAKRKLGPVPMAVREASGWVNRQVAAADLGEVTRKDVQSLIDAKHAEFDGQRKALAARSDASAMDWYKLGRFAWQHRLDEEAVSSLMEAVQRDPEVLRKIQDARRAAMPPPPAPTPVEPPKPATAAVVVKPVEKPKLVVAGGAKPEPEAPAAEQDPESILAETITGTKEEAKALQLAREGQDLSKKAFSKGNSTARDILYQQAISSFKESVIIYDRLRAKEKNKDKAAQLEQTVTEVNRQLFWARKASRPD